MDEMESKPPTSSYHHQRTPRTPESYFNVPESIALLNIVKSERIQSAFQSNRKNHASVWEMVADVLNRFSARKRTAKQCCNRYENLKKIYTQLKKNPERHVRRNWPYMILFKEIEEQRGECWGSNGKRLALITKNHNELSYYHRRRQAAELGMLLSGSNSKEVSQHSLLQTLAAHTVDSNSNNCKMERFLPNHFVETQLGENSVEAGSMGGGSAGSGLAGGGGGVGSGAGGSVGAGMVVGVGSLNNSVALFEGSTLQLQVAAATAAARKEHEMQLQNGGHTHTSLIDAVTAAAAAAAAAVADATATNGTRSHDNNNGNGDNGRTKNGAITPEYEKDCNGALNLQTSDNNISMKSEPMSDGEFNPDDIQLMQTNYNGAQNFYSHNMEPNILHPDVIVDTDNLSDCSSIVSLKSKRKLSSSTDGDSTNYELIEYLKRREKRDEELLKRMDAREERLLALFERTVVAIEALAAQKADSTNIKQLVQAQTQTQNQTQTRTESNSF